MAFHCINVDLGLLDLVGREALRRKRLGVDRGREVVERALLADVPFRLRDVALRKLENGLGRTPRPEETDRPGDGRTEGRTREEPEAAGTLVPAGRGVKCLVCG